MNLPAGLAVVAAVLVAHPAFADDGGDGGAPSSLDPLPVPPPSASAAVPPAEPPPVVSPPADAPNVPLLRPEEALAPPHLNLEGTVGVGTPVGWLGIGASIRPSDLFALSVGAGLGSRGTQLASMLHAYPIAPGKRVRLGLGAGVSSGSYVTSSWRDIDLYWDRYFQRAWFLNMQASVLVWERSGVGLEPFVGYGIVLNDSDGACAGWRRTCSGFNGVFFLGVTLRYGFWL